MTFGLIKAILLPKVIFHFQGDQLVVLLSRSAALLVCVLFWVSAVAAQSGWRMLPSVATGDLVAVYFTSAERGWVAGDDGYLASTDDGGRSWRPYPLGTDESINEIYFRNDDNGYLVAGKKMFLTKDAGRSWQETKLFNNGDFRNLTPEFISIRFSDKKRGLVIGSLLNRKDEVVEALVMRTGDGGETWSRVAVPTKRELFHLDFNGSSHGWIVGDGGLILATQDGGLTWRTQNSGVTRALFNIDFRDDETGYAVGGGGTIIRTVDGGTTWRKVSTPYAETLKRIGFSDDKNGWIVGHKGIILRTIDGGQSWTRQDSAAKDNLYGLFMSKRYGCAVGAKGLIATYQKN